MSLLRLFLQELKVNTNLKKFRTTASGQVASVNDLSAYDIGDFRHTYPEEQMKKIEDAIYNRVNPKVRELMDKSKYAVKNQLYKNDTFIFYRRKDSLYFYAFYFIFDEQDNIKHTITSNLRLSNHRSGKTVDRYADEINNKINFFINEYETEEFKNIEINKYIFYTIKYFNAKYIQLALNQPLSSSDMHIVRTVENPKESNTLYNNVSDMLKLIIDRNKKRIKPLPIDLTIK